MNRPIAPAMPVIPYQRRPWFILNMNHINQFFFWSLAAFCIWNLNAIVHMGFDVTRAMSFFILLACIGLIATCRANPLVTLGRAGGWCMTFFFVYLMIGSLTAFGVTEFIGLFVKYANSVLLILAAASGAWSLAQHADLGKLHLKLFIMWFISSLSIWFSGNLRAIAINPHGSEFRNAGFFSNPNEAGAAASICFAIGFALLSRRKHTYLIIPAMLIAALAVLQTFSKTAILVILGISAFHFLQIANRGESRALKVLVNGGLILGSIWLFTVGLETLGLQATQLERLMEVREIVINQNFNEETTTTRTLLLQIGLDKFGQSPFIGSGLGSFHAMEEAGFLGSHNTFLMVFGESGMLAGILLVAFMISLAISALRSESRLLRNVVLGYLIVFALNCLSSHTVLNRRFQNFMIGYSIGMVSGYAFRRRQERALGLMMVDDGVVKMEQPPEETSRFESDSDQPSSDQPGSDQPGSDQPRSAVTRAPQNEAEGEAQVASMSPESNTREPV